MKTDRETKKQGLMCHFEMLSAKYFKRSEKSSETGHRLKTPRGWVTRANPLTQPEKPTQLTASREDGSDSQLALKIGEK